MMHSFAKFCIDPEPLFQKETLAGYLTALKKQSNLDRALIPYHDQLPEDDEGQVIKAPRYFGAGGEFLYETFFECYGSDYNLCGIESYDDEEKTRNDGGVDFDARSRKLKIYKEYLNTKAAPGTPIFIQGKTSINPMKIYTTNDGSRIMNFFGHAQALARAQGCSLSARYILITTGKGIGLQLEQNTLKMIQVIAYNDIKKRVDGDRIFWNKMRERFGFQALDLPPAPMDPEYKAILAEIEAN
jgi:hypothetical protein